MNPALSDCDMANARKCGVKIMIAAGGSGGHIFPAVALARSLRLKETDADIMFVGSNKSLDRMIFEKEGFRYRLLSGNKLPYRVSLKTLVFFMAVIIDSLKALLAVAFYRPDVVIGFGGYVASPVSLASYMLGIPVVAHEQNVVPGRANRLLFRISKYIAISFEETKDHLGPERLKVIFTGNPVRAAISAESNIMPDRNNSFKKFGLDPNKFTILVMGGSQGAHKLNLMCAEALSKMECRARASLQIVHITGVKDYGWVSKMYGGLDIESRVYSFMDAIEDAYRVADLIVTRSGASAIFEIALFGKPMILVPYPFAMSHQIENAKAFSSRGAAIIIEEKDLSADNFRDKILNLLSNQAILIGLARSAKKLSVPRASDDLADVVLKATGKRQYVNK